MYMAMLEKLKSREIVLSVTRDGIIAEAFGASEEVLGYECFARFTHLLLRFDFISPSVIFTQAHIPPLNIGRERQGGKARELEAETRGKGRGEREKKRTTN